MISFAAVAISCLLAPSLIRVARWCQLGQSNDGMVKLCMA